MRPQFLDLIRDHLFTLPVLAKFALGMVMIVAIPRLCRRLHVPAAVGLLLGGVIIGPYVLGFFGTDRPIADFMAELGKLLLMFFAGLEIDLLHDIAKDMLRRGEQTTRAHNNCSGKHAGMIALARHKGWLAQGYALPDHPVQRECLTEVARWAGLPVARVPHATDGCGVPSFVLPLRAMALAWARLGAASNGAPADNIPDDARAAAARLLAARSDPTAQR